MIKDITYKYDSEAGRCVEKVTRNKKRCLSPNHKSHQHTGRGTYASSRQGYAEADYEEEELEDFEHDGDEVDL